MTATRPARRDDAAEVAVDGRRLRLSNLEKVLFPATGFTKHDLVDYYARVAPAPRSRHLPGLAQ